MRRLNLAQQKAWPYVRDTQHPALFMDMRLGKTLLTIRTVQGYENGPTLVVAPGSALIAWGKELKAESVQPVFDLRGTRTKRKHELDICDTLNYGWALINKEGFLHLPEIADVAWHTVILDESTFIKNPKANVTKFFLKYFRFVPHRWILTGNPNPNGDLDLWSQLAFLDGRAFSYSSYWNFQAKCFEPGRYNEHDWQPISGTPTMIKRTLARRAFVLKRKDIKADVPKTFITRTVELPAPMRKAYDILERLFILDYEGKEVVRTKYTIERYQLARQLCGGFIDKKLVWKGKLKELVDLLTGELKGEKVVVWAHYIQEISAIWKALNKKKIHCTTITGKVSTWHRERILEDFNTKKKSGYQVLVLQPTVARTGIDLSISDTCIYYGPPFGVETWVQSQDRIIKIGKKHALIITLCVKDTIDDAYFKALRSRTLTGRKVLDRAVAIRRKQLCQE